MANNPDGGAAFPVQRWDVENSCVVDASESGMSLRDYFAAKAMQTILHPANERVWSGANVAEEACSMADAMLAERDK